ncbi:hypothetical protein F4861DRAFT_371113 [Xylaria intraflava]|nr:hypothetical protein F4861DRAFT_371113 [Xylaria intraflava]
MASSLAEFLYVYHHLFLPSKLPQQDDYNPEFERVLLSTAINGLTVWKDYVEPTCRGQADAAISMLYNMQRAYLPISDSLNNTELLQLLNQLTEDKAIPLYVREQNAGVLISKQSNRIFFDVFEIWQKNEATMATKGRLIRSFPGSSVAIGESEFQQRELRETIAHTLANMSKHPVEAMQPKAKKAGSSMHEDRDTNHPGMVSEVFVGFLKSIGEALEAHVIVKHIRDDVLWDHARSPWRRSPSWLLIRVALQLAFTRNATLAKPDVTYKEAMLFILSHVVVLATKHSVSSDVLFSMNAKLARRLIKMELAANNRVLIYVQKIMKNVHDNISKRWLTVQKRDDRTIDLSKLSELDFTQGSHTPLPDLDKYLAWMGRRQPKRISGSFQPSSRLMVFSPSILPQLPGNFSSTSQSTAIANLEAFETWVTLHCRAWSRNNRHTPSLDVCDKLGSLIVTYHNLALLYYSNPEALSSMLLTIFEIWVACDEAAVELCPLLGQYNPNVPRDVLQNLLLPFASQMRRLHNVEAYLAKRSTSARFSHTMLYYDLGSPNCFPARFFDLSEELQETYNEIITKAEEKKKAKLAELDGLKTRYNQLMALADQRECDYENVLVDSLNNFYELQHKRNCQKCRYESQARDLEIHIHEWPLPRSKTKAKTVVFELCIPRCIQSWRQATFYLLRDVIKMKYSRRSIPRVSYSLSSDRLLPSGPKFPSEIGLLSENKPQEVTHRQAQRASTATESSVCVNNGLDYKYFDSSEGQFVEPFEATARVLEMCTYYLPTPSKGLQKYLLRPATSPNGPGPNDVLANQSQTPQHMGIEEARDLALVPLGQRVQLYNVLVQLAAPSIDFRKEETAIFILQCLYQAGPPGGTPLRVGHAVIDDERFALCLLENVAIAWHRVKENWESSQALSVFAAITARVLSLTSSKKVQLNCLELLGTLRAGAFAWVELLRDKAHNAATPDDGAFFKLKSVDIALICASCFDVEQENLSGILKSDIDASIFIQCSIIIQEGKRVYNSTSELMLACLQLRFHRLLYRSSSILSVTHSGLSDAVKKAWSGYQPRNGWRLALKTPDWLVTETASGDGQARLQVHYNLLSGELLVNGVPLSRPPPEYEAYPLWQTLFGRAPVEVMPTSAAGMQFSAKMQHKGYGIHFGLNKTSSGELDLLVQASNTIVNYETIPPRLLRGIFPHHFINDFVHWYNHMNDTLEFRPQATPWNPSSSAWILSRSPNGWALKRKGSTVLGTNSEIVKAIAHVLFPLAEKFDIHVFLDGSSVEAEIPALRLGFFLNSGQSSLQSRDFPGMRVDDSQSLGTLIGFANKLILKDDSRRLVLVPEGPVSWESAGGHIKVVVSKESITKIHALHVDSMLGRLIDNGNLQGKLFLSYLHALTSYCLPDPLTKKTGVEQALWILNSAAVRSFDRLSQPNIDILEEIARLNPKRQYYPKNERVMQTVTWVPDLSCLSHHDGFYKAVAAIFEHAKRMSLFYPESNSEKLNIHKIDTNEFLMERDRIRSSTFRVAGFGAEEHTTTYDDSYDSRDRDQNSTRGSKAYLLSCMLYNGCTTLHTTAPRDGKLWRVISTIPTVMGPSHGAPRLEYSANAVNSGLNLSVWPALHKVLSTQSAVLNRFSVMMWLSAIAAHKEADMGLLQVLALFFTTPRLGHIELPSIQSCRPPKGYEATYELLGSSVRANLVPFWNSPEADLRANTGESRRKFENRRNNQFNTHQNQAIQTLVTELYKQWPRETLAGLDHIGRKVSDYVNLNNVKSAVTKQFRDWFNNRRLLEYLQNIELALSSFHVNPLALYRPPLAMLEPPTRTRTFISVQDLFDSVAPTLPMPPSLLEPVLPDSKAGQKTLRLEGLLDALKTTARQSRYETTYIEELQSSMQSLRGREGELRLDLRRYGTDILRRHLDACKKRVDDLYLLFAKVGAIHNGMSELGHGPRLSPLLFLQQLSNGPWKRLNPDWRACIACYGLALSALQRAERLVRTAGLRSDEDFIKELMNVGHRTWGPLEHPEWMLLEVESGIMIRTVQEHIAYEMITPRSRCNAVMQLNMGEGKSSVIVPMVATKLANRSQLARVIVAKPQSKQMAQMLTSKLGGLLDRRVYYMPFSRALKINSTTMTDTIDKIMKECKDNGGILLVQPEHLLSFQLMGLECYCSGDTAKETIGKSLIRLQDFFDESRDIVDESDENFSPKFELIYTMGSQRPIELSPSRWICMQQVLDWVRFLAADLADKFPQSMDVDLRNDGGFPRVRILRADAGELLVEKIARCICEKGLDGFPIARQQKQFRDAVFKYITQYNLTREEIVVVEESDGGQFWTESTKPLLLLLRGILAGGVLTFALGQKRWRVNFGLATSRIPPTQLAVPYRAKDNPTPRSEFSHPDVVILLTSLTYYYGGLEDEDLFIALGHLMNSDQATVEYEAWIRDSPHMPASFRQLEGINLKDRPQCIYDVFPHLKYGKSVIDYFLGHIVFPKEVKEFPYKLSASGWDIGKRKAKYTTGFSGTNDSRKVLPLDVKHLDLESQSHTNALVLEYLLQPENSVIFLPDRPSISTTDAERFLDVVVRLERPTRVILDVGAQILELNNQQVAQSWLRMVTEPETQAAVFINDDDELTVVDRRGSMEPLQTSSYATRLDACLVFLDEAHTRGIDLKMPDDYRAAVTLGANLTKDRLVQACMRLRKLGRGQSVVFCISAEIKAKIQEVTGKSTSAVLGVSDVLHWAISETFTDIRRGMPLWATQGDRFLRQEELWKSARVAGVTSMSKTHAKKFLEDEAQPIEARYGPRSKQAIPIAEVFRTRSQRSGEIVQRCNEFEDLHFKSSTLQEEQERELSPETEQERQVQRPPPAIPADHSLHPDVAIFADTGRVVPGSPGFMPAFHSLRSTSAAGHFEPSQLSTTKLFVTKDFADAVRNSDIGYRSDSFQRPVQWILSASNGNIVEVLMIISPYEAEQLIPKLQSSSFDGVALHVYKPRCHTSHSTFDNLDFFTIPPRQPQLEVPRTLLVQLNLFAGQLYFKTYEDYLETCSYLGLAADVPGPGERVAADGYILSDKDGKSKFDSSPVKFLHVLTSKIRRNGQGISKTNVGGMLEGKLLQRSDIEGQDVDVVREFDKLVIRVRTAL